MNISQIEKKSLKNARQVIRRVLSTTIENPNNPDSLSFFQADTYRFCFYELYV